MHKQLLASIITSATLTLLAGAYLSTASFHSQSVLGMQACTDFTYGEWSSCLNGKQTRQILSSAPTTCSGGNPEVERKCTVCTDFKYSEWTSCRNDMQMRSVVEATPTGCVGGIADLARECNAGELIPLSILTKTGESAKLSTSSSEIEQLKTQGYRLQVVAGSLYTAGGKKTTALYSLLNPRSQDQRYTTDVNETNEFEKQGYYVGIVGYVYIENAENLSPLFAFKSANGKYTYTSNENMQLKLLQQSYQPVNLLGYIIK